LLRPAFAVVEAGAGHAFAEAAFAHKIFFQPADQLVKKVVGLVDGRGDSTLSGLMIFVGR
jgi:hypothetical protein